jgi:hypothetical protein
MGDGITCLVTIHGIGFQQAPGLRTPGYADRLHQALAETLGPDLLSDDPQRTRSLPGEAGPIYVQSSWPPDSNNHEAGLSRLGRWVPGPTRAIDTSDTPSMGEDGRIAHIALVYSQLQDQSGHLGAALEAGGSALFSLGHYASLTGLVHMVFSDAQALFHHSPSMEADTPSLARRSDLPDSSHHPIDRLLHRPPSTFQSDAPSGLFTTLRTLEADVAAYVTRNDLRERVRAFVRDALHRICYRDDVSSVIVNAHSNGTVVAFDVLSQLTPSAAAKVRYFVTAGSPLRKYADLFYWGTKVGAMASMGAPATWTNFWDERDPVADPLSPPVEWRRGSGPPPIATDGSLFQAVDADRGSVDAFPIDDRQVDNIAHSIGGGLQAHNYWDNEPEVVHAIAKILRTLVEQ